MTHGAYFHLFRRDTAQAKALAESALRLAMEQGFGLFIASAKIVLGEVVQPGAIAAGIARIREGSRPGGPRAPSYFCHFI
jgi:hypothetical protein